MYKTRVTGNPSIGSGEFFDWNAYFDPHKTASIGEIDDSELLDLVRGHLREDPSRMGFVFSRVMRTLLKGFDIPRSPKILELGAATGYLGRWLQTYFGGQVTLVDNAETSFAAFRENVAGDQTASSIRYLREDIFKVSLEAEFDLVGSFGLIEHFSQKFQVLDVHRRFLSPQGLIIILVPTDTPLTRTFLEIHHELNQGYRELLTDNEFRRILVEHRMNPLKIVASQGYVYDFSAAICRPQQSE